MRVNDPVYWVDKTLSTVNIMNVTKTKTPLNYDQYLQPTLSVTPTSYVLACTIWLVTIHAIFAFDTQGVFFFFYFIFICC